MPRGAAPEQAQPEVEQQISEHRGFPLTRELQEREEILQEPANLMGEVEEARALQG